jgi:uracil-DNA glycosylase family 4
MIKFTPVCGQACQLHKTKYKYVFGRGDIPCDILFLGMGPGRSEDLIGEAFIGESGKLLDKMCHDAGLNIYRLFYTNIVLCHPTDKLGGKNRDPSGYEIATCFENVLYIIGEACPRIMVFAGALPHKYYHKAFPEAFQIHHPSYLLQSGGQDSPDYLKNIRVMEGICRQLNYQH